MILIVIIIAQFIGIVHLYVACLVLQHQKIKKVKKKDTSSGTNSIKSVSYTGNGSSLDYGAVRRATATMYATKLTSEQSVAVNRGKSYVDENLNAIKLKK